MAITTNAITNSFKEDLLNGLHDFAVSRRRCIHLN
jgi:hypothetical protein